MPRTVVEAAELAGLIGREVGVSDWIVVDQDRINGFADVTDDHQFIHVDPERAAETVFGGAIAHGFLTLSLLAPMSVEASLEVRGVAMGVNYGFDRVRFLEPVRAGGRVRGRFTLLDARSRGHGRWMLKYEVEVEIEGGSKPALKAEWLTLQMLGD
jgi:acyl dehydratase